MQAKFRKKLRSLSVTVPVLRDLRGSQLLPAAAESDAIVPTEGEEANPDRDDGGGNAAAGVSRLPPSAANAADARKREVSTSEADTAAAARRVPSMAAGLEDEDAPLEDPESPRARAPADVTSFASSGGGVGGGGGGGGGGAQGAAGVSGAEGTQAVDGGSDGDGDTAGEQAEASVALQEQTRGIAAELKEKGNALVKGGKHAEAVVLYDQSIRLWPDDPAVYTNRALCRLKAGDHAAAAADCRKCLEIDASFVRAHERLGAIYEAQKDPAAALREYEAGLAKQPGHAGCARGIKSLSSSAGLKKQAGAQPLTAAASGGGGGGGGGGQVKAPGAPTDGAAQGDCVAAAFAGFDVEVKTLAGRGRGVVARRALAAGALAVEARPMACVVHDKYSSTHCHFCFKPLAEQARVTCRAKCGGVVYCSKACAAADTVHTDGECQVLAAWQQQQQQQGAGSQTATRGLRLFMRLVYSYGADKRMAGLCDMLEGKPGAQDDANCRGMVRRCVASVQREGVVEIQ